MPRCMRASCLSTQSLLCSRFSRRSLKVSSRDQTISIGVTHFPERGLPLLASPRRTCVRTSRGVSDPLRSGRRVRFALRGGGRSRPGTDVDHPMRRLRRHRAPPTSGRLGSCMFVRRDGLRMRFSGVADSVCDSRVAPSPKRRGRLRFEPSAPLSPPSHVEGGQLRSRRLSPLLSPVALVAAVATTGDRSCDKLA